MTAFPRAIPARRTLRRYGVLVPPALALLAGATACGGTDPGRDAAAPDDDAVVLEVDDPYASADMAELSQASDAVVRGTVVDAEEGLRIGQNDLRYTAYTVEVDEALAGAPGDRVRVALGTHLDDGRALFVDGRPRPEIGDEGVWFLTAIGSEFDVDGYVLTGQAGELLLDGDTVHGGGVEGENPVADEVERLDSPEAVVDHVRDVAG